MIYYIIVEEDVQWSFMVFSYGQIYEKAYFFGLPETMIMEWEAGH